MEHAVTKPIVRRGCDAFREGTSAMLVIVGSIIPQLPGLASSFGVAFECTIKEGTGEDMVFRRAAVRYWVKMIAG
jgi:hypothetical protein